MKKIIFVLLTFFVIVKTNAQENKQLIAMSKSDSLLLSFGNIDLVWGNDSQSIDFFAIAPNGDYFSYDVNAEKLFVNSPNYERKFVFEIDNKMNLGLWNTTEQPFFVSNEFICLSTPSGQYYFYLENNQWKSGKQLFPKALNFGDVKILHHKEKLIYVASKGNDDSEITDKSFSEIGFIEENGKKIVPKYRLNVEKKPIRYVGYKFFQAYVKESNLIVWEQTQKKIYVFDEGLNLLDSISIKATFPDVQAAMCHLLQNNATQEIYLMTYTKDSKNALLVKINFNQQLSYELVKKMPALFPLYIYNNEIFFGISQNNEGKMSPFGAALHRMIYKMKW